MRLRLATLIPPIAVTCALTALAHTAPPPNLEPLPQAAPPPSGPANAPDLDALVLMVRATTETIEEYRVNGRLTMVKVIPKTSRPYYLVADGAGGTFVRRDSLDTGIKV